MKSRTDKMGGINGISGATRTHPQIIEYGRGSDVYDVFYSGSDNPPQFSGFYPNDLD